MPLNDDPHALSDEEYNALYNDPGLTLHEIPADVLAKIVAKIEGTFDEKDVDDA